VRRTIAGYPAELLRLPLSADVDPARDEPAARTMECWAVADLDTLIDRDTLLRAASPADPPYWALPWIGARAIAAAVLASPLPASARVLEIGCGLGLAGVAAGTSGARVLFSDYVPEALEFARANAEHHALPNYDARLVDFTSDRLEERFDVVVAADVVYEPESYEPLVRFLCEHTAPHGRILLTETLRADAQRVLRALEASGFDRTTRAVWVPEEGKRERTWLHELHRD
jgi:predicted nicotinamide N-methyase